MFCTWIEDHANQSIYHAMHTAAVDHQFIPVYKPGDKAGNRVQLGGLRERLEGLLVATQFAEHHALKRQETPSAGPGRWPRRAPGGPPRAGKVLLSSCPLSRQKRALPGSSSVAGCRPGGPPRATRAEMANVASRTVGDAPRSSTASSVTELFPDAAPSDFGFTSRFILCRSEAPPFHLRLTRDARAERPELAP